MEVYGLWRPLRKIDRILYQVQLPLELVGRLRFMSKAANIPATRIIVVAIDELLRSGKLGDYESMKADFDRWQEKLREPLPPTEPVGPVGRAFGQKPIVHRLGENDE